MHKAMRGLILEVLTDVADKGLPGNHHFFVTFDTMHPDVEIADWLSDRYPGEMTIVIQHQYEDLNVTEQGFSITLSFGDSPFDLRDRKKVARQQHLRRQRHRWLSWQNQSRSLKRPTQRSSLWINSANRPATFETVALAAPRR